MISICKCQYCGREFEAKRRDASCCPDRKCQSARWRKLYYQRPEPPRPVYLLECQVCGKKFKATNKLTQYCSPHCRTVVAGKYRPKSTVGFADSDSKRIARRRREVYARMRKFSCLDGMRSRLQVEVDNFNILSPTPTHHSN